MDGDNEFFNSLFEVKDRVHFLR